MSNLAVKIDRMESLNNKSNIIPFDLLRGMSTEDDDSNAKKKSLAGKSSEVYAFRNKEEISAMISVFDKHIEEASNNDQKRIAKRNKMIFVIGINIGIRASDLRTLQWVFFFNEDGSRKDRYKIQPKKTRKQKKFITMHFNKAVESVISDYISDYPFDSLDEYLFASRKGEEPINVRSLCRIIKDAAAEAGIEQNIGSHSLRKTFGYWVWHTAEDKNKALVILMNIFNHSSAAVTSRYIGITDDEMSDTYNNLNLGLDMI